MDRLILQNIKYLRSQITQFASPAVNPNDNASQNSELTSENEENLLVPYNTKSKICNSANKQTKNKISM